MVTSIKAAVFWDVAMRNLVDIERRFREADCTEYGNCIHV
jgi:hypothetical protein